MFSTPLHISTCIHRWHYRLRRSQRSRPSQDKRSFQLKSRNGHRHATSNDLWAGYTAIVLFNWLGIGDWVVGQLYAPPHFWINYSIEVDGLVICYTFINVFQISILDIVAERSMGREEPLRSQKFPDQLCARSGGREIKDGILMFNIRSHNFRSMPLLLRKSMKCEERRKTWKLKWNKKRLGERRYACSYTLTIANL